MTIEPRPSTGAADPAAVRPPAAGLSPAGRRLAAAAALLAALAAALAAAGSHLLAGRMAPAGLVSFKTAVAFQFVNAIGLFAAIWVAENLPSSRLARYCGPLLLLGILLFCGSVYAASLGWTASAGVAAPIGGSAVILAWTGLALALLRGGGGRGAAQEP